MINIIVIFQAGKLFGLILLHYLFTSLENLHIIFFHPELKLSSLIHIYSAVSMFCIKVDQIFD